MAHQIGIELCKKILIDEYEFVLSTHMDKVHIHNHIIFNNVNIVTGKCYQSNKRSYHKIRYQSDKLCKENNLSVIDDHIKESALKRQNLQDKIKDIDREMQELSATMEQVHIIKNIMPITRNIRRIRLI